MAEGSSTGAKYEPFFSADSKKSTSYGAKLELKMGTFSAPCQRSLMDRLHELIKCPSLSSILDTCVVHISVLALVCVLQSFTLVHMES